MAIERTYCTNMCDEKNNYQCIDCENSDEEKESEMRIGMLRQWLNEDRITDVDKLVTNDDIKHWLNL